MARKIKWLLFGIVFASVSLVTVVLIDTSQHILVQIAAVAVGTIIGLAFAKAAE